MSFYQWLYEWWVAFAVMAGGALFLGGGFMLFIGLLFSAIADVWQTVRLTLGV